MPYHCESLMSASIPFLLTVLEWSVDMTIQRNSLTFAILPHIALFICPISVIRSWDQNMFVSTGYMFKFVEGGFLKDFIHYELVCFLCWLSFEKTNLTPLDLLFVSLFHVFWFATFILIQNSFWLPLSAR